MNNYGYWKWICFNLNAQSIEEYMVFYSQEEFDEYVREHNLSEEDYIDGFIHCELPPEPFLEEK